MNSQDIRISNEIFTLTISEKCIVKSLILNSTGEEFLDSSEPVSLFSITEERPYNNEIKLAHPNKKTIFNANKVTRQGDNLIVGFELVKFEAVVKIVELPEYIYFEFQDFIVPPECFEGLSMSPPPVSEFRLIQLPIKKKERFGEWLNVMWDDETAVNVLATSPHARIDAQKHENFNILTADAIKGIKLRGCGAAIIVSKTENYLNVVDKLEKDFDLPRGVESRRNPLINSSIYWVLDFYPQNVEKHIAYAKKGGFRLMLINYGSIFKEQDIYGYCSDYNFNSFYENGFEDLKVALKKVKDAGITPGLHFLHTHIGKYTKYITPVADHRLNLTRYFTLAKPLSEDDNVIYVEENPEDTVMFEKCRVLKFGGELIHYESYSVEPPYCFKGCVRGHWNTNVTKHNLGEIGGILDISEYCANSVYINQNTSLQEEIGDKIAQIYNCGFEFVYFDGSEGTNSPFDFHIPNAQYRVYKKFNKAPIFCEGAAKAHFSWHMLSGGNAFDVFPSKIFKEMTVKYPFEEAPRMANDFTRVNFGWWAYYADAQPDWYEYATSLAASCDCPATLQSCIFRFPSHKRNNDVLEAIRRWEDVRAKGWLTKEHKEMLKNYKQEHFLLINENKEYELLPYNEVKEAAHGDENARIFVFERKGRSYAVCWHKIDTGTLNIPISSDKLIYEEEIGGKRLDISECDNVSSIILDNRHYLSTDLPMDEFIDVLINSTLK